MTLPVTNQQEWLCAFEEMFAELRGKQLPIESHDLLDDTIFILNIKGKASFRCSVCFRSWKSLLGRGIMNYYIEIVGNEILGTLFLKVYGQRCSKCPIEKAEFDSAVFTERAILNNIRKVLRKVKQNIFKEDDGDVREDIYDADFIQGDHDKANCEACILNYCDYTGESSLSSPVHKKYLVKVYNHLQRKPVNWRMIFTDERPERKINLLDYVKKGATFYEPRELKLRKTSEKMDPTLGPTQQKPASKMVQMDYSKALKKGISTISSVEENNGDSASKNEHPKSSRPCEHDELAEIVSDNSSESESNIADESESDNPLLIEDEIISEDNKTASTEIPNTQQETEKNESFCSIL